MTQTFGGYVVGYVERDKIGKVIPRMSVPINYEESPPITPMRAKALLDEAAKMTGRALVAIEIRNLLVVQRDLLDSDTIDEKWRFTLASGLLVRTQNGRVVQ